MNCTGIVHFQIGRLIGQQGIGGAVGFVESILRKLLHQVENLDGGFFGNLVFARALR